MTKEQLSSLITQAQSDAKLQDKLKAIAVPDSQHSIDDVVLITNEANSVISNGDLAGKQDLTKEELEAVMGGNLKGVLQWAGYSFLSGLTLGGLPALDASTGWKLCNNIIAEGNKP